MDTSRPTLTHAPPVFLPPCTISGVSLPLRTLHVLRAIIHSCAVVMGLIIVRGAMLLLAIPPLLLLEEAPGKRAVVVPLVQMQQHQRQPQPQPRQGLYLSNIRRRVLSIISYHHLDNRCSDSSICGLPTLPLLPFLVVLPAR